VVFLASREGQIDAWVHEVGTGDYRNVTHGQSTRFEGLKIRVSAVRFCPWPPFKSETCIHLAQCSTLRVPIVFQVPHPRGCSIYSKRQFRFPVSAKGRDPFHVMRAQGGK